ncbi:hypothetical protein E1A91_A07G251000v1 [Gossypium mustelinum]|uniref:Uncharacterized protein n=1 Tax=Gossypium mustelinum TaxID=34275 RepID=A0A5D2YT83_GOSMU|nr:hypothetical protein E1A91_A07G251000v1 [Gossypium mustelinum]
MNPARNFLRFITNREVYALHRTLYNKFYSMKTRSISKIFYWPIVLFQSKFRQHNPTFLPIRKEENFIDVTIVSACQVKVNGSCAPGRKLEKRR